MMKNNLLHRSTFRQRRLCMFCFIRKQNIFKNIMLILLILSNIFLCFLSFHPPARRDETEKRRIRLRRRGHSLYPCLGSASTRSIEFVFHRGSKRVVPEMKNDLYRPKIFFDVQFLEPLHVVGHREHQVWLGVALILSKSSPQLNRTQRNLTGQAYYTDYTVFLLLPFESAHSDSKDT